MLEWLNSWDSAQYFSEVVSSLFAVMVVWLWFNNLFFLSLVACGLLGLLVALIKIGGLGS